VPAEDVEGLAILGAAREALLFIASRVPAYDFFVGTQQRDLQCGIVYAPEEALEDVHFRERGFPIAVDHDDLGRTITYPGPPFRTLPAGSAVRRPPHVGEHDAELSG
jgi:crotonobetainyl-CoA:carnitine CoA-transferase CaiB-like acyl-CoA transferase